jgi:hypothetical protein
MSIAVHNVAFQHTVLIWANMPKMPQLKLWPIIVHRNAIPEKQPREFATVDTQRAKHKPYRVQSILQLPRP